MEEYVLLDSALSCCPTRIDKYGDFIESDEYDAIMELPTYSLSDIMAVNDNKTKVARILWKQLCNINCDTCEYNGTDDKCCDCEYLKIGWKLSYKSALDIVDKICEELDE